MVKLHICFCGEVPVTYLMRKLARTVYEEIEIIAKEKQWNSALFTVKDEFFRIGGPEGNNYQ